MDQKNWVSSTSPENQEDGDEEALSLCDLPTSGKNPTTHVEDSGSKKIGGEDFEFGSWVASVSAEPEMCAADEVFFNGQILPFRHSVSSDSGLAMFRSSSLNPSRCVSRSESMDHRHSGAGGFVSSRSSSIRSHNSSTSGSSNSTLINNGTQRLRNQFHSHPSPSPQIRSSSRRLPTHRSRNSTVWSLFRVGLVQPPEIEFKSLKLRNSRNSKSLSSSRNSTSSSITINLEKKLKNKLGFFSNCKCSVDAIDTVPLKVVTSTEKNCNNVDKGNTDEGKDQGIKKNKQTLSRHRTFEWLKDLSLISDPNES